MRDKFGGLDILINNAAVLLEVREARSSLLERSRLRCPS